LPASDDPRGTQNRGTQNRGTDNRGIPDAGQRGVAPADKRAARKSADTLLMYSKGFGSEKVDLFNQAYFNGQAGTQVVDSWADILKVFADYASINKLVFLVHSNPGVLLFGADATGLHFTSGKKLTEAAKELTQLPEKPTITTVDFAGCNVGFDLDGLVEFGLALDAKEVIATNHFHEFALDRLQVRAGQSDELEKALLRLRGYITSPASASLDALVKQAKTKAVDTTVLLEWYVASDEEHRQPFPNDSKVNTDQRAKTFKRPSSALGQNIQTMADLEEAKKDIFMFQGQEPIRALIKFTVQLQGFRQAVSPKGNPPDAGRR
jgi:hypothetical protein